MRRRQVLALCGLGVTGLAGCQFGQRDRRTPTPSETGESPTDERDGTPTSHATSTATPLDVQLTVEGATLQRGFVSLNVDAYGMVSADGSQYLFVTVAVTSDRVPALSDLGFRFDGSAFSPRLPDEQPAVHRQTEPLGDAKTGWVLFELPAAGDASDAALVWPGGEWRPGDRLRTRLAAPLPSLSLEAWRVPETVVLDSTTGFELAVRNDDDLSGRFVAAINATGWAPHRPIGIVSRLIPPATTETWEVPGEEIELFDDALSEVVGDGESDITYELVRIGGTSEHRSVRVVEN